MVEAIDAEDAFLTDFDASVASRCELIGVPDCLDIIEEPKVPVELRDVCTADEIVHAKTPSPHPNPGPEEEGKLFVPVGTKVKVKTACPSDTSTSDTPEN
jgi:hypothetical protein